MKINFTIEEFKNNELNELTKKVSLEENIDYQCKFIVARNNETFEILGVTGINFKKTKDARFEHIIISTEYQKAELGKAKLGLILMMRTENWLRDLGYKFYNAFIYYDNKRMRHFAERWGMVETIKGNKGSWFVKDLIPNKTEKEYRRIYAMA